MIDEKALQAAIPVGSNMANADLVRAIITAYLSASAEPVAAEARTAPIPDAVLKAAGAKLRARQPHPGAPDV